MKLRYWAVPAIAAFCAFAVWTTARALCAPSSEEAMQRSLAALKKPELVILYALHPDACSIVRSSIWGWSAACEGVPQHFYRETMDCETRPSETPLCRPATTAEAKDCRSFFWDIDLDGKPFDSITHRSSHYASLSEECKPKGTPTAEREEMNRRGIQPVKVEIYGSIRRFR